MSRPNHHSRPSFRRAGRNRKTRTKRSFPWLTAHFSSELSGQRLRLLSIEPLESRQVLSAVTITVDTANDTHAANPSTSDHDATGSVSLRSAIEFLNAAAVSGATVDFGGSIGGAIDLSLGELLITEPMTISGPGAGALTVSGNSQSRLFDINDSNSATTLSVTIDGLTLTDGNGAGPSANNTVQGGAIYNTENLTLGNLVVTGNTALGPAQSPATAYGGGIYNAAGASLAMSSVTVSDNKAAGSQSNAAYGGGIYNAGSLTSTGSTINGNTAQGNSGNAGRGGGIYNAGSLTSSNDTLDLNTAKGAGGGLGGGYGGGIDNAGSLALTGDTLNGNTALGGLLDTSEASAGYGGGIYSTASLTSTNDKFSGNTAQGGGPIDRGGAGYGGGIYSTASLTSTGDELTGNTAAGASGTIGGDGGGGGIYSTAGLTLTNDTFTGNIAQGGGGGQSDGKGGNANGGGIYSSGVMTLATDALTGNTAKGGNVGSSGHAGNGDGGGIYSTASLNSSNDTLAGNTAQGGSNSFGGFGGNGGGGGIYSAASLTLTNDTLAGNTAQAGSGGTNGSANGGGIDKASGTLHLANNLVAGNTATNGANVNGATDQDNGGNLIGTSGELLSQVLATDVNGNPVVANHGGPTQTIALVAGSPAIGAAKALTTLAANLNDTDTTLTVGDATFVAVGEALSIDQEIVVVSGINGTAITVARGQDGTTAASHTSGAALYLALDQRGFLRNTQDIGAVEGPQASIVVNTLADTHADGYTTLREAITQADAEAVAGGVTVTFAASLFASGPATIDLTNGQIEISESMTISGPGANTLTIDQTTSGGARLFQVDATDANGNGVSVSMSGLRLTGGVLTGDHGAGISNLGNLSLDAMTFSGNSAVNGGGLYNASGATAMVTGSTFSANTANFGGGIGNLGTLALVASTISANTASQQAGGLYNFGTATVIDSTFSGNSAVSQGGGIGQFGTATVIDSTLSGNSANAGGGIYGKGALASPTTNLVNTIIAGNLLSGAGGSDPDLSGKFATTDHDLIGDVGDATDNSGGAIVGNLVGTDASPIDAKLGPLANSGGPTETMVLLTGSPAIAAGGALAILSAGLNATDASVTVSDATFIAVGEALSIDQEIVVVTAVSGNTVTLARGQNGTVASSHASGALVYLALDQRGVVRTTQDIGAFEGPQAQTSIVVNTLADTHVDGFTTLREAVEQANGEAGSAAITFDPSLFASGPATIDLTQGQIEIAESMTIQGPGAGSLKINQSDPSPRGVFLVDAADGNANPIQVSMSGLTISGGRNQGAGGGIDNEGALTLDAVVVSGNAAATEGGGIYNAGNLTVTDSTISDNSSNPGGGGKGGGIYNDGGTATLTDVVLSGNSASFEGGIATSGIFTVTDSTITDNDSTNGSSIANSGTLTVHASTISNNSTESGNGGGINNIGNVTVVDSTISDNSATTGHGGGLYNTGTATVVDSTISGNVGYASGGGIDNSGVLAVVNTTLSANSTGGLGTGGAVNNTGTATLTDSTLSENSATHGGGVFNASGAVIKIANAIVAGNNFTSGGSDPDVAGSFTIASHDLIGLVGDATGFSDNGNVVGTTTAIDPLLGPLADNGGLTQTMALLGGSPALGNGGALATTQIGLNATDASDNVPVSDTTFLAVGEALSIGQEIVVVTAVDSNTNTITISRAQLGSTEATHASGDPVYLAFDQRGLPRVVNGATDIGAFQSQTSGQTGGNTLANFTATAGGIYTIELVSGSSPQQIEIVDSSGKVLAQAPLSSLSAINFTNASGQSVQLIVDSTNGAVPLRITFDGGVGTGSSLVLQGGTATSDTYAPGPNGGQGTDTLVIGGVTETVSFTNLTPVYDSVAGPVTVTGTNGNDAISYVEGDDATGAANTAWGQVTVNNLEALNFTNKSTLTINTGLGADTVSANNPNTSTGMTGIAVNGGDPNAGDLLITSGVSIGGNTLEVQPTGAGAGTIQNLVHSQPVLTFGGLDKIQVVGGGAGNTLFYSGTAGSDTIQVTPGATPDSGFLSGTNGGYALIPVEYRGIDSQLWLGAVGGGGTPGGSDTVVLNGTSGNDSFSAGAGAAALFIEQTPAGAMPKIVADASGGTTKVVFQGDGGSDTFKTDFTTLDNSPAIQYTIVGNSSGADTLTYIAHADAATTIDLANEALQSAGANPVNFSGLASIKLDADGGALTVADGDADTNLAVTPSGAGSAAVEANGAGTLVNVTNAAASGLTVSLPGGGNTLTINGSAVGDAVTAANNSVTIAGDLPIDYTPADLANLAINGRAGNDTFTVTPSATVPISVDGGDPVAFKPGDAIDAALEGPATYYAGPTSDSGSFVVGAGQPVSFVHMETVAASFTSGKATPTVAVSDSGGTYNGLPFPATATVAGVVANFDTTPAASLEGVAPTFLYYVGSTVSGTGSINPPVGAGTYTVVASFAGSADYSSASAQTTFTIGKATPTVTVTDSGGTYNGSPFPASATVTGVSGTAGISLEGVAPTFVYYVGSTVSGTGSINPPVGAGTYTVVSSFAGSADYTTASAQTTFTIGKATPTVTVTDVGGTYNGSPFLASATVTGASGVAGVSLEGVAPTLLYYVGSTVSGAGSINPPVGAGTYTVVASFAGSPDYTSASAQATFTIDKATPSVSVTDAGGTYNGSPFPASAIVTGVSGTAGVSLEGVAPTFLYYVGGTVSGTGSTNPPVGAGTYTVVASFAGSADYTSVTDQTTFTIGKAAPTVSVTDGGGTYNGSTFAASANLTGVSGTPGVSLEGVAPTLLYYAGSTVNGTGSINPPVGAGTYTVVASFAGSPDYISASDQTTFTIGKATPTVVVTDTGGTYNGSLFPASATVTGVSGTVATSLGGVAPTFLYYVGSTISGTGSTTAPTTAGTYTVVASFAGSPDYTSAADQTTFTIGKATPTVSVTDAGGTYNGSPFPASATVTGVSGTAGVSLEGVAPTFLYYVGSTISGTGSTTAPTTAGTYTVVASFAGSPDYTSAADQTTFTIGKATPTVSVTDAGGTYNGSPFPASATVTGVSGTAGVSLEGVAPTFLYYVGSTVTGAGSTTAPIGAGTYTVVASFAGSPDYTSAADQATFTINKATPTVSVTDAGGTYNGSPFPARPTVAGLSGTPGAILEGVAPTFVYYVGSTVTGAGSTNAPTTAGTYTVVASFAGSADYTSATGQTTFTIGKATPAVAVTDVGGTYNGSPFPASATVAGVSGTAATSLEGVAPTFLYYVGSTVTGAGSTTAPTAPGTYTVVASFAGSADYTSAADSITFVIAGAAPAITSAKAADFAEGSSNTVTIAASGLPTPALTEAGALPAGLTFVDNHDGTATLSGTPGAGTHGTYQLTISAHNGVSPDATQSFTLTVSTASVQSAGFGDLAGVPGDGTIQTFVDNLYRELLGREPDAGGSAAWSNLLRQNDTAAGRAQVVSDFMNSAEYKARYVTKVYEIFLGRAPDAGGLQFWTGVMGQPGTPGGRGLNSDEQFVLAVILGSDEFYADSGNTATGFANALFHDLLGRSPAAGDLSFWAGLAQGASSAARDGIALDILRSPETEHLLLDSFYPDPGGDASHPLPAPGTPVPAGSPDLAVLTGDGWENLYLQGSATGSPEANDAFFTELASGVAWDDVQLHLLASDQYYTNPNRPTVF